ncbi:hypothetical protein A6V25_12275 [Nostoc sp. ATCC 53789]|nr:hypothetical protein A6V25_12275 [Nostoc sp. ATCC 53789]
MCQELNPNFSPFKVTRKISYFFSALRQLLQVGEPAQRTGFSVPLRLESIFFNQSDADGTESRV